MGSCLSKKTRGDSTSSPPQTELKTLVTEKTKRAEDQETLKKEFFITKHRTSHDLDRFSEDDKGKTEQNLIVLPSDNNLTKPDPIDAPGSSNIASGLGVLRTSSCTKEEIDAILIQCGRLSRSSSTGKTACSGSSENQASGNTRKRSYDFDQDGSNNPKGNSFDVEDGDDEQTTVERIHRHRQRHSSGGRRRTPSRERDQQQRSGGSRRVSRSPTGRRSESPTTGNITNNNAVNKPGKIIPVPATVNSIVMEKKNNLSEPPPSSSAATAIKRTQVKEIPVGSRIAASPRSQSPAKTNVRAAAENPNLQQQPLSLSRSNSRKAEQSPFRRNPLGEIDQNMTTTVTGHQKAMVNNGKTIDNNPTSYTALLLEDIQKFHQKKKKEELETPFVEDGVLEKSMEKSSSHQYVTVRRKGREEEEESSGSNSVVSGGHNWVSADSTDDCWTTSSSSSAKEDPIDIRRRRRMVVEKKGLGGFDNKKTTTGIGSKRNLHSIAASS